MQKYNPYRPGGIITPGMFAGRYEELKTLAQTLYQTRHENPHHFLLSGERGIGKSSLLYYLELIARGSIRTVEADTFNFLTLSIELESIDTFGSIIKKIGKSLQDAVAKREAIKEFAKSGWDFLKRWEVMGVKYASSDHAAEDHELLDNLCSSLSETVKRLSGGSDGCLILIDEADKPVAPAMGALVKLLTERLTKLGCHKVAIGLAGVTGVMSKLRDSHESAPRIFHAMTLGPLEPADRLHVINLGLIEAKKKNGFETTIREDAAQTISVLSEGYPNFIQQFSFCAFDADSDNDITVSDVTDGANKKDGAFQQLGQKYFSELYFEQIGSDEYRQVLRAMALHEDRWVTKKQLRDSTEMKAGTLNNAITALKRRNIITAQPGRQGVYKLPTRSFAVWIRAFTVDSRKAAVMPGDEVAETKGQPPSTTVGSKVSTPSEAVRPKPKR
jgi:hypothetical protein